MSLSLDKLLLFPFVAVFVCAQTSRNNTSSETVYIENGCNKALNLPTSFFTEKALILQQFNHSFFENDNVCNLTLTPPDGHGFIFYTHGSFKNKLELEYNQNHSWFVVVDDNSITELAVNEPLILKFSNDNHRVHSNATIDEKVLLRVVITAYKPAKSNSSCGEDVECESGICISHHFRSDGIDNCGNNCDEMDCRAAFTDEDIDRSITTTEVNSGNSSSEQRSSAATIGTVLLVICVILFVSGVAIGLYCKRKDKYERAPLG